MPIKPTIPHGDLAISQEHAPWIETSLAAVAGMTLPDDLMQSFDRDDENFWAPQFAWARPYRKRDKTLIVPVSGVLMHNFPMNLGSWATGYDYIVAAVQRGMRDPDVEEIILHVNSPGGLVAGCFDAVDEIYAMRGEKPIIALADEAALSAGYAIASAADEIVTARTGLVGSIGVIAAHMEISRALDDMGVTVNLIFAGDRKADGHPSMPLSDEARARMQQRVNNSYEIFVSTVARNRGMSEEEVRATEADYFTASEAVQNGLADSEGTLGILSANAEVSQEEDIFMSGETPAVDQAATQAAVDAATKAGRVEGATAERARIAAIMDSDEASARPKAARQVALKTDMAVDDAKAFLAGLDEEKAEVKDAAPKGASAFEKAMTGTPNPGITSDDGAHQDAAELTDAQVADGVFASIGLAAKH